MQVLFATSNSHKIFEANAVGQLHEIEFEPRQVDYPEIRSNYVAEIATEGAKYVYSKIQKPVIVEDSGLFVESLKGFPGPYSRFVYEKIGCEGIMKLLSDVSDKSARFISAVGYADESGVKVFEGQVKGILTENPRGSEGFGYDPIFIPLNYNKTFAEDVNYKNKVSHRRMAFELLCSFLKNR